MRKLGRNASKEKVQRERERERERERKGEREIQMSGDFPEIVNVNL